MEKILRIGTRDSQLAVWQATLVQQLLQEHHITSELVDMKSDGDIDLITPLYEIGVQGVFTKTLDAALLSNKFDIAVHSMKDVPTQLAKGIVQAAVLPRASYKDILVYRNDISFLNDMQSNAVIATSSIRRKAQWLNRYPNHQMIMVLDGAGWHRNKSLIIPDNIRLLRLPAYSPELNPTEILWHELREKCCANRVFETLDAVCQEVESGLRRLASAPTEVTRLSGWPWIINSINLNAT